MKRQFFRYAVVGVGSNLALYLVYLALVERGLECKLAMTCTYALGVVGTFVFNRSWSFGHKGQLNSAFVRYIAVYAIGYVVSYLALAFFVDVARLPHQWVQASLIPFVAVLIFVLQKHWVFGSPRT